MREATTVIVSLGSNLGNRMQNLAFMRLKITTLATVAPLFSRIMETEPVGIEEKQEWYYNQLVRFHCVLSAPDLLEECQTIENERGRTRPHPWAARTADIDIIFFGEQRIQTPALTIPHPQIMERRFILEGLKEIGAEIIDPITGTASSQLCALSSIAVQKQQVRFLENRELS